MLANSHGLVQSTVVYTDRKRTQSPGLETMVICHLEAYLAPAAEFLGVGVCIKVTFL